MDESKKQAALKRAADMADAITSRNTAGFKAMFSIYSDEELAAGIEIGVLMVFLAGQMCARGEAAGVAAESLQTRE